MRDLLQNHASTAKLATATTAAAVACVWFAHSLGWVSFAGGAVRLGPASVLGGGYFASRSTTSAAKNRPLDRRPASLAVPGIATRDGIYGRD